MEHFTFAGHNYHLLLTSRLAGKVELSNTLMLLLLTKVRVRRTLKFGVCLVFLLLAFFFLKTYINVKMEAKYVS